MSAGAALPAAASFVARTVLDTWLLAVVSLCLSEQAAGGQLRPGVAWRTLRGRLVALAGLGLAIRVLSDALTPLGIGLVLSAGWSLALPAAAVERLGFSDALRASWQLSRRHWLRIGALRLAAVLVGELATAVAPAVAAVALPGAATLDRSITSEVVRLGAQTLIGPFPLAVQALLYVEARTAPIRDFSASMAETGVGSTPSARAR